MKIYTKHWTVSYIDNDIHASDIVDEIDADKDHKDVETDNDNNDDDDDVDDETDDDYETDDDDDTDDDDETNDDDETDYDVDDETNDDIDEKTDDADDGDVDEVKYFCDLCIVIVKLLHRKFLTDTFKQHLNAKHLNVINVIIQFMSCEMCEMQY